MRAQKVQKRAAKAADAMKMESDIAAARLRMAVDVFAQSPQSREAVGDMLFYAAAAARCNGADGEELLQEATNRFISRFSEAEEELGSAVGSMDNAQSEAVWGSTRKN